MVGLATVCGNVLGAWYFLESAVRGRGFHGNALKEYGNSPPDVVLCLSGVSGSLRYYGNCTGLGILWWWVKFSQNFSAVARLSPNP